MSLSDVAEQLHIRSTYLQAIEEEDWPSIGAAVYVRGFLRTYARFLGLDPEHAVDAFNQGTPSAPPTKQWSGSAIPAASGRRGSGMSVWAWLATVVALALIGYVGYGYYQLKAVPAPTPRAAPAEAGSAAPSAVPAITASPVPEPRWTGKSLVVRVRQLSWLRVSVNGKTVMEGEFPPGTQREFTGHRIRVMAGNAGGVEVSAPGQPTRILGSPGQVVERDYAI